MSVTIKEIKNYENFGKCLCISNENIEVYVTVDIGPRIIRFGFIDGENLLFNDVSRKIVNSGESYDNYYYKGAKWCIYGGHRLWIAPESEPETYYPDNFPVKYNISDNGAEFIQQFQRQNGVQFSLYIEMSENNRVTISHRIVNESGHMKRFAPWALTVLNKGGFEIIPQNSADEGLLPNRKLALWSYSDMSDNRIYFGKKYITLCQDEKATSNFKLGTDNESGIAIYLLNDMVFTKMYSHDTDADYPDGGVSFETYTSPEILEIETLGALKDVADGECVTHVEEWYLSKNDLKVDPRDERSIDALVQKLKK